MLENPIELTTAGATYDEPCRVMAIVWEGSTTAGDQAILVFQGIKVGTMWRGRAVDTNTYAGVMLGPHGIHAPSGFRVSTLDAGTLLVYVRED